MRILITGGTGFIGKALALELLKNHEVSVFALDTDPGLEKLGVSSIQGDISDPDQAYGAVEGSEVVFHTAARTGIAGRYRDFYAPNVLGTENLLKACGRAGVKYLVYTGSPSAVFRHEAIEGLTEDQCFYPDKFLSYYEKTKALAEQLVVKAGKDPDTRLKTIIARPHLVYGPGDTNLLPRLEAKAKKGALVQVGKGDNLVSLTYIDNAVLGHLKALEALSADRSLSGNCYFINDGTPVNLWEWVREYLENKGLPGPKKIMKYKTAYFLGGLFEALWKSFGIRRREPPITRFVADQFAMSHYYSIEKARAELGFKPRPAGKI